MRLPALNEILCIQVVLHTPGDKLHSLKEAGGVDDRRLVFPPGAVGIAGNVLLDDLLNVFPMHSRFFKIAIYAKSVDRPSVNYIGYEET